MLILRLFRGEKGVEIEMFKEFKLSYNQSYGLLD